LSSDRVDALIFGGGVAGLWTLRVLLEAGLDAWLVETVGLGAAQSTQAQGIVHGGGKYALRRVGDVEAIRRIREMPQRWRDHRAGRRFPSLERARTTSEECWLWLPAGSWRARLEAVTLLPLLRHGGVLASAPRSRPRAEWPLPLQRHAYRAYSMAEPVLEPVSVIDALAEPVRDRCLRIERSEPGDFERQAEGYRIRLREGGRQLQVHAKNVVACAGEGNASLLECADHDPRRMQRRPLRMGMVKGDLPLLCGHCVLGGRTRLTVTTVDRTDGSRAWQVGGEIAERHAGTTGDDFFSDLVAELQRTLPGLSLSQTELADYPAVRAEAANEAVRRPSGVQVEAVDPAFVVAWPTKWALAPLLAEEVAGIVAPRRFDGGFSDAFADWARADISRPPWERATWRSANSVRPA
jgi:glycine/D-amino acid oxidase-like deaminating enzyme